jgi:4-alpha-glucanotransferase
MKTTDAEKTRVSCLKYLQSDGCEINWDFIRAVLASVADKTIIPLQDVLGLGSEARMNTPNTTTGNWSWRFADGSLTTAHAAQLKRLTDENKLSKR